MTATALRPGTHDPAVLHWPGRQVLATDLWFPGEPDPLGRPSGSTEVLGRDPDPLIYIAWVRSDSQRGALQPRTALHVEGCGG
jgi:hypothetical protein